MYLENKFDSEDAGEDEIEFIEYSVSDRILANRIFGGQRNATGTDDDHSEQVEVSQIDDEMTESTNSTTSDFNFGIYQKNEGNVSP